MIENKSEIIIYQNDDNQTQIDVRLDNETVWLSLNQISTLFDRNKSVISRHIRNIFIEEELTGISTVAKFATVQNEGGRIISREIEYYNLDMIISIGYRVKSKRGIQFRIWANKVLKDYLVQGFALNERLLKLQSEKLEHLSKAIKLINSVSKSEFLNSNDTDKFLEILDKFSQALNILDDYDYKRFHKIGEKFESAFIIEYDEVIKLIAKMKYEIGNSKYFGKEKDESLKSSLSAIYQTFDGVDLYPTLIEKASNLLYFLVKNHSFVDGNKRIAAALFIYFLDKNDILNKSNINNDLLVTLTLMIANSNPADKDLIVNIVAVILGSGAVH